MKGEYRKRRPGPIDSVKWRDRNSGEHRKRSRAAGAMILLIALLIAILLVRCDAPEPERHSRVKTCSACGWEDPHHAGNCKYKQ